MQEELLQTELPYKIPQWEYWKEDTWYDARVKYHHNISNLCFLRKNAENIYDLLDVLLGNTDVSKIFIPIDNANLIAGATVDYNEPLDKYDSSLKIANSNWVNTSLDDYAHYYSPSFSGTPTLDSNPSILDNSSHIATTSWVKLFLANDTSIKLCPLDSPIFQLSCSVPNIDKFGDDNNKVMLSSFSTEVLLTKILDNYAERMSPSFIGTPTTSDTNEDAKASTIANINTVNREITARFNNAYSQYVPMDFSVGQIEDGQSLIDKIPSGYTFEQCAIMLHSVNFNYDKDKVHLSNINKLVNVNDDGTVDIKFVYTDSVTNEKVTVSGTAMYIIIAQNSGCGHETNNPS